MGRQANMTDEEIDQQIQAIIDEGDTPSINLLLQRCAVGRVRAQKRLAAWHERQATEAVETAALPTDVRDSLVLTIERALADVTLRERKLAQGEYARRWAGVEKSIAESANIIADLEKKCQLSENENIRLKAEVDTLHKSLLVKTGEYQQLEAQLSEANTGADGAKAALAIAEKKVADAREEIDTLKAQVEEYKSSILLAKQETEKALATMERAEKQCEVAETRADNATKAAQEVATQNAELREHVRNLQKDVDVLTAQLVAKEGLVADLALAKDEVKRLRGLLYEKNQQKPPLRQKNQRMPDQEESPSVETEQQKERTPQKNLKKKKEE